MGDSRDCTIWRWSSSLAEDAVMGVSRDCTIWRPSSSGRCARDFEVKNGWWSLVPVAVVAGVSLSSLAGGGWWRVVVDGVLAKKGDSLREVDTKRGRELGWSLLMETGVMGSWAALGESSGKKN